MLKRAAERDLIEVGSVLAGAEGDRWGSTLRNKLDCGSAEELGSKIKTSAAGLQKIKEKKSKKKKRKKKEKENK